MADPVAGRAAVVGGSLGGLNAALWLADAGWDVEVLERSRSPLEGRGAEPFVQLIVDVAVPRMVFGRICLLGDAAFALRPHAAVGTAKAAEDAWQLARALQTAAGDVDGALIAWEESQLQLGRQVAART